MNKLSKLMMGLAALSFAACSSDEPTPAPTPDNGEGTTMYLSINITDANNARSRAAGYDENGTAKDPAGEGDYVFGDEHEVKSADFLFFDGEGNFVTNVKIWKDGTAGTPPNIEYQSNTLLVLRGLKEESLPQYVITLLNVPADLINKIKSEVWTMDKVAKHQLNFKNGANFVMSTTSFIPEGDFVDNTRYEKDKYYATKLFKGDFMKEEPTTEEVKNKAVNIYVERLAAKFSIAGALVDDPDNTNFIFPVKVTVAGLNNDYNKPETTPGDGNVENPEPEIPSAHQELWVKLCGIGLTGQEANSYLSKNIDEFKSAKPWVDTEKEPWNKPSFYRSFWAQSPNYGPNPVLTYTDFPSATSSASAPIYGFETTNSFENIRNNATDKKLIASNVTNVIFTARVYGSKEEAMGSDNGTKPGLDLIEYNGFYFTKDQFKTYVLGTLQNNNQLNFYKNYVETETPIEGEGQTGTKWEYSFDPMELSDFTCDYTLAGDGTGIVKLTYTGTMEVWKRNPDDPTSDKLVKATKEDIDAALALFDDGTIKINAFTGGAMYYSIPIEHLLGTDKKAGEYTVEKNGEYGVVRNHWYMLTVSKIARMGHGVFNPNGGGDGGEKLIPTDPTPETFALSAKINILSWKIVQQGPIEL